MRDILYKKVLFILILFQPVVDIITSFMTMQHYSITIGIVLKIFVLLLAVFYLVFFDKEKRWKNLFFLLFIAIFAGLNIYNNLDVVKVYAFKYFNYLFKYIYHVIILYFFLRWYKTYKIELYMLRIPMIIITFSCFLSLITGSAYLSYDAYRIGVSGWYSSANELGNLLVLLYPVAIYNAFHNKDGIKFDFWLFVLIAMCLIMIGTKVGLLGFYCISLCYLGIRLLYRKKIKLEKGFWFVLLVVVSATLFVNKLPAVYNVKLQIDDGSDFLLSGRKEFYEKILGQYEKSSVTDKLIGFTYVDTERYHDILIVEQDFFDIFFMYGIVGLVIVVTMYSMIYIHFIKVYLYSRKKKLYSKKYLAVVLAISVEFAIAFIAGHSLLSPSVSTYLSLLIAISLSIEHKKDKAYKKSVLTTASDDSYTKIDREKYEVYVLGQVDGYFCVNQYITKPIFKSKLFNNRFMAYLLTRNQKYDYILCNTQNTFEKYTLLYTEAREKYGIIDKDRLFQRIITIHEFNILK